MRSCSAEEVNASCDACGGHVRVWRAQYGACSSCGSLQLIAPSTDDEEALQRYLDPQYHEMGEQRGSVYFQHRLDSLATLVGPVARVLEIGAGTGLFAEAALRRGFDITAIEPGARYPDAEHRLGKRAHRRSWQDQLARDDRPYDAIVAWEVIEHLADPAAFARAALRRLTPHGVLMLSTPHSRSWSVAILRDRDPMLCPDEHLRLFSRKGLVTMLRNSGAGAVAMNGFGYLLPAEVSRCFLRIGVEPPRFAAEMVSRATCLLRRTRLSLGIEAVARPRSSVSEAS